MVLHDEFRLVSTDWQQREINVREHITYFFQVTAGTRVPGEVNSGLPGADHITSPEHGVAVPGPPHAPVEGGQEEDLDPVAGGVELLVPPGFLDVPRDLSQQSS